MNSPTLMPPLSPLSQPPKGKSNVRIAVITIIALHAVFFGGLLLQGCKRKPGETAGSNLLAANTNADYGMLTNPPYAEPPVTLPGTGSTQQVADTLAPAPTNVPLPTPAPATPIAGPTTPAPIIPAPATPATPGGPREYTIVKGDIPVNIAKANGVPLKELLKANPGLDPRRLQIGQKLVIPAAPTPLAAAPAPVVPSPAPGAAPGAPDAGTLHVVKGGENLTRIAKQHGVSVKALRAANSLKTDRIHAGQKLKVPAAKAAAAGAATAQGEGAGASAERLTAAAAGGAAPQAH
jgi:LysM repeat protein